MENKTTHEESRNRLPFVKMSGGGNDFIIIDDRRYQWQGREAWLARALCPRGTAVGADGLILVRPSEMADARMAYFNSGGDRAALCGNGGRCLASYLHRKGLAGPNPTLETDKGLVLSAFVDGSQIRLEMAPISWPSQSLEAEIATADGNRRMFPGEFLTVGVPHFVHHLPADELSTIKVNRWGAALRGLGIFGPTGTNVNFYSVVDKRTRTLAIRTYERGVEAETMACGTGSTATALVAAEQFGFDSPVRILTNGGSLLTISFTGPQSSAANESEARWGTVMLAGEGRWIFDGLADLNSF